MINRLIIFLIRKRLGLKNGECFRFSNQKSPYDEYYFDRDRVMKISFVSGHILPLIAESSVSLNWLLTLDPKKDIYKVEE